MLHSERDRSWFACDAAHDRHSGMLSDSTILCPPCGEGRKSVYTAREGGPLHRVFYFRGDAPEHASCDFLNCFAFVSRWGSPPVSLAIRTPSWARNVCWNGSLLFPVTVVGAPGLLSHRTLGGSVRSVFSNIRKGIFSSCQ